MCHTMIQATQQLRLFFFEHIFARGEGGGSQLALLKHMSVLPGLCMRDVHRLDLTTSNL